jgi:hypothetical protein
MTKTARLGAWLAVSAAVLASCTFDVAFRRDRSFKVLSPNRRATVDMPLTVRWTKPESARAASAFAVFIDRAPPPAGKPLTHLFRNDPACKGVRTCLSEEALRSRGVYFVRGTSLRLDLIGRRFDAPKGLEDLHELTVVPLDERQRRMGASSAWIDFWVDFKDT